jgi:hypothetical protein
MFRGIHAIPFRVYQKVSQSRKSFVDSLASPWLNAHLKRKVTNLFRRTKYVTRCRRRAGNAKEPDSPSPSVFDSAEMGKADPWINGEKPWCSVGQAERTKPTQPEERPAR